MVSLIDLSSLFVKCLGMLHNHAIKFARFLVEGLPDDDEPDFIEFDPARKVDLQTVIVRLMSNSRYPLTYNDQHEDHVKEKFTSSMRGKS
jgi:hypothetical protein